MTYKFNPFTGKLDTSEGPQGPAGVVSAAGPGSQATPSISFAADLDTGLYNYTPNGIAVSTDGVGRLFIDSSGNVSIPAGKINAGTAGVINAVINSADGLFVNIDSDNSSANEVLIIGKDRTGTTAGTELLRITEDGKLGLGISGPSSRLHVFNDANTAQATIASSSSGNRAQVEFVNAHSTWSFGVAGGTTGQGLIATATENVDFGIYTRATGQAQSEKVTIKADGNVGIGTTNAASLLDIRPGVTGSQNAITMGYGRSANPTDAVHKIRWASDDLVIEADSANTIASNILFFNDGGEKARIDSSGRLLVGTDFTSATGTIFAQGSSSSTTGPSYLYLQRGQAAGASIGNGTSIGIVNFADNASGVFAQIAAEGDAPSSNGDYPGRLVFSTTADGASSSTPRMTIKNDGKVGIGTQSPGYTLDVAGTVNANATFRANDGTRIGIFGSQAFASGVVGLGSGSNHPLVFGTNANERARITSDGNFAIDTQIPNANAKLSVSNGGAETFEFQTGVTSGKNTLLSFNRSASAWVEQNYVASAHTFNISGSSNEVARIDSSGRLLVGTVSNIGGSADARDTLNLVHTSGGGLILGRDAASVTGGSTLGSLRFYGNAGGTYELGASIAAEAESAQATGDKPTRLVFSTTADGAATPTPRMTIKNDGKVGIGSQTPNGRLAVAENAAGTGIELLSPSLNGAGYIGTTDEAASAIGIEINSIRGNGKIVLKTNSTERVRIDSNGYFRLSSNSGGIQFNGDTAAANALDDYEEGTFTPTLTSTNADTVVGSYQTRVGIYTKVGNLVTITISLATDVTTAGTGNVILTGLPFTSSATNVTSLSISQVGRWTTQGPLAARTGSSSTTIILEETDSAVDPNLATALSTSRLTTGGGTKNVMILSGSYRV